MKVKALTVQVKNGRIVVDEPTDLPDGSEVEVVVIDDRLTPASAWSCMLRSTVRRRTPRQAAAWMPGNISSCIEPVVKLVLLAEAQRRFEAPG